MQLFTFNYQLSIFLVRHGGILLKFQQFGKLRQDDHVFESSLGNLETWQDPASKFKN